MSRGPRFAVHLFPDAAAVAALGSYCDKLAGAFDARATTRLPVHVTVKGFFAPSVGEATLIGAFNELPEARLGRVRVGDVVAYGHESVAIQVGRDERSGCVEHQLMTWHQAVIDTLMPLVHSDCEFTRSEWCGDRWDPHVTVASHDVTPGDISRVVDFVRDLNQLRTIGFDCAALIRATSSDWKRWWTDVSVTPIAKRSIVPAS